MEKDRNRKGKCRRWEHNQEHCEGNIKGWLVGGRSKRGGDIDQEHDDFGS